MDLSLLSRRLGPWAAVLALGALFALNTRPHQVVALHEGTAVVEGRATVRVGAVEVIVEGLATVSATPKAALPSPPRASAVAEAGGDARVTVHEGLATVKPPSGDPVVVRPGKSWPDAP